ncbi:VanZ family protein [Clostridium uliginosum]|uniref:VanZ like family protein n=1 Tax=Clostridium uliginosum TaxID=119641 RepID=A0A1I1SMF0_9CLOT|nr:VanZ family protein [Clostridium uliginosum]SFD47581.1 VanZ like family protein [Clostridium uliginosum]
MKNKRKIIYWGLLIGWMTVIFIMSNQPAVVSDKQSTTTIMLLSKMGIHMSSIFGELSNFIIRKISHFLEYMILGILTLNVLGLYYNKSKIKFIVLLVVFAYACSDEFHQLFIPGREGAIRDVIIDTLGGATSIFIMDLKHKSIRKKNSI